VVAVLALEEDCSTSFNVGHRPVPEVNGSMNLCVKLRECLALPHHVICHPGVEDPSRALPTLLVTELNKEFRLVKVNFCQC
jgi:hypothetical protein